VSYEYELGLFAATGVELEYMIVGSDDLDVEPIADRLLAEVGGSVDEDVERGDVAWSNELVLHVIEIKTNGPTEALEGVAAKMQENLRHIEDVLEPMGARLMPTAMHPWMDPHRETRLWPHENNVIYETFNRIFDCRGHGWANLQSTHLNLPFANDDEFGRLHAAIRLALPMLPALTASSPFADGEATGLLDTRMEAYRGNAARVPSVGGLVVPEGLFTRERYERDLLGRIYDDMENLDPEGILRHEWVNARGCIARFDRGAIEIRVLDIQESPRADLAMAAVIIDTLRDLVNERTIGTGDQREWDDATLAAILGDVIRTADETIIRDRRYLRALGYPERDGLAKDVWQFRIESLGMPADESWREPLSVYLEDGCLARRILRAAGSSPSRDRLRHVYGRLADCLSGGEVFRNGDV